MISRRTRPMRLVALLLLCTNAATIITTTNAFAFHSTSRRRNHARSLDHPMVRVPSPSRIHHTQQRERRQAISNTKLSATTLGQTISQLTKPASASALAQATPAMAYFLVLCGAGVGLPVSEDVLCIFAGTMLSKYNNSPVRRIRLITALYLGVVISDLITFSIGRMMKVGLLEPLRKRMNHLVGGEQQRQQQQQQQTNTNSSNNEARGEVMTTELVAGSKNVGETKKLRKRDKVIQKLESAGDWAGFYARLSVGFRPAMMILAGFSGRVSFAKYIFGTAVGGIITLPAQLLLGYSMRHMKPSDILAVSSKLLVVAPVALISALVIWLIRQQQQQQQQGDEPSSKSNKKQLTLTEERTGKIVVHDHQS